MTQLEVITTALMGGLPCNMIDDTCECEFVNCGHAPYSFCEHHDSEDPVDRGEPCPFALRLAEAVQAAFAGSEPDDALPKRCARCGNPHFIGEVCSECGTHIEVTTEQIAAGRNQEPQDHQQERNQAQ